MGKAKAGQESLVAAERLRMQGGLGPVNTGIPDRVFFSCGLTLSLGKNTYESARVDAGMATDVRPDETLEEALLRAKDFVTHEVQGQAIDVRRSLHDGTEDQPVPTFKGGAQTKKRRY
jgi:hypothetical protein